MPISEYYGGHGREVMHSMKEQYGEEKGKRVFYATANKRKKALARRRKQGKHSANFDKLREMSKGE